MTLKPRKRVMLSVARAIDEHHLAQRAKAQAVGFNMGSYVTSHIDDHTGHACKTTACMAGWIVALFDQDGVRRENPLTAKTLQRMAGDDFPWRETARDILQITDRQAFKLFTDPGTKPDDYGLLSRITPEVASTTLRRLAKTGKVQWPLKRLRAERDAAWKAHTLAQGE